MEFQFFNLHNLPPEVQKQVAERISAITRGEDGEKHQMLPVSASELLGRSYAVVAFGARDGAKARDEPYELAGFVSALDPIEHNSRQMSEVGTLVVEQRFRRYGLGTELVTRMVSSLAGQQIDSYTFANPKSSGNFKKADFRVARTGEIPGAAFEACLTCPALPPSGCCDTIMIKESIQ